MSNRTYIFAGAILLLAASGCSPKKSETARAAENAPVRVRTFAVEQQDWPSFYEATGTVRARTSVQVSSRVMAYAREVRVRIGDQVRAGQPLVILDARDLDARRRQAEAGRTEARASAAEADHAIAAAQANLQLAEVTYKRMKDLYDKRSLSDQEFDEASTRVKSARANLEMAQSRRGQVDARIAQAGEEVKSAEIMGGYSVITSPISGVVTEKSVEAGNLATPGAPLMTIEQAGAYRLEAAVEESNLAKVRLGQPVTVVLDALPGEVHGRVSEIVPAVDPASRAFTVKIDLPPSAHLRSGQFGRARFESGRRTAISIPSAAVQEKGQIQWVYAIDGNHARTRMITLGDRRASEVEVLSGLSSGERIVYPVPSAIRDAARVEVEQ